MTKTTKIIKTTKTTKKGGKKKKRSLKLMAPFPKSRVVVLRYADTFQLDPDTFDVAKERRYRANSLYDPDRTGVGHQPRYFDQMAEHYEEYEVLGARAKVYVNTTAGACTLVGINRDNDTTTDYSNRTALMENPNSRFKVLASNGSKPLVLTCNWSARKTFGKNYVRDDNTALITANPVNESDFVVWAINQYGTENPGVLNCTIVIDYIARFKERKEVAQS